MKGTRQREALSSLSVSSMVCSFLSLLECQALFILHLADVWLRLQTFPPSSISISFLICFHHVCLYLLCANCVLPAPHPNFVYDAFLISGRVHGSYNILCIPPQLWIVAIGHLGMEKTRISWQDGCDCHDSCSVTLWPLTACAQPNQDVTGLERPRGGATWSVLVVQLALSMFNHVHESHGLSLLLLGSSLHRPVQWRQCWSGFHVGVSDVGREALTAADCRISMSRRAAGCPSNRNANLGLPVLWRETWLTDVWFPVQCFLIWAHVFDKLIKPLLMHIYQVICCRLWLQSYFLRHFYSCPNLKCCGCRQGTNGTLSPIIESMLTSALVFQLKCQKWCRNCNPTWKMWQYW